MRLRLLLLRHAKSDWPSGKLDDHERPLNARGRKSAPRMGAYVAKSGPIPTLVLCSTARRTRETLDLLMPHLSPMPKVQFSRGLYLAEWPKLLEAIRKAPRDCRTVLVIGHNPGLGQLAHALTREPESKDERSRAARLAEKFPTCALAVFDVEARDWHSLEPGTAALIDYVRPKDLADDEEDD